MFLVNYFYQKPTATATGPSIDTTHEQKWLNSLEKQIAQKPAFELNWIKNLHEYLIKSNIPSTHPLHEKIAAITSKHPHLKNHITASPHELNAPKELPSSSSAQEIPHIEGCKLEGKYSLNTCKEILKAQGSQFKEIILHEVDDEILALIVTLCPTITSLKINTADRMALYLTDAGINSIASLKCLTIFEFNCWVAFSNLSTAFTALLSTPAFRDQLKELKIIAQVVFEPGMAAIGQFKQLTRFEMETVGITTKDLLTLLQSKTLSATLEKLTVITNDPPQYLSITDDMLAALTKYTNLKEINLGSNWQISEPNLLKFLDAKQNLQGITLRQLPITPNMAAKLQNMTQLSTLHFDDCSQLFVHDFCNLLNNKNNATDLFLGQAGGLFDQESTHDMAMTELSQLPNLKILNLAGMGGWSSDFDRFCTAPSMIHNIQELYLSNTQLPDRSLANIRNLQALTTLRIDNCPAFNDDTLQSLFDSPLKNQISTLQLSKVSITENSWQWLNAMPLLQKLLIANCFAISMAGRDAFFDLENLQKNLTVLLLDSFLFRDGTAPKLAAFNALNLLIVFNNSFLTKVGESTIENLETHSNGRLHTEIWYGEDDNIFRIFKDR